MSVRLYLSTPGANGRYTMWIRNANEATSLLCKSWMEDVVDDLVEDLPGDRRGVSFNGPVQLTKEVGERLIEEHTSIELYETENDEDS